MINTVQQAMVRALAERGSWMGRDELQAAARCGEARADDELADLVMAGTVLFNDRAREYRLAGGQMARAAVQRLIQDGVQRQILGRQSRDKARYEIGLAVRSTTADGTERLTMAELEMPYPKGAPQELLTALWAFGVSLDKVDPA